MKRLTASLLTAAMIVGLTACGSADSGSADTAGGSKAPAAESTADESTPAEKTGKVTELKWGSVHPDTAVTTQMMMMAIDEINENAEGIHITGYPNGTLGGSAELVEGVQAGLVDIITEGPSQFSSWIPAAGQIEAPYLWQSVEHMQKALNGDYKDNLNAMFEDIDVQILGTFYYGTRQLTANKEIHTLADLEGMKIRVPQADMYVKMIESWNAAATPMNLNELYMALQTGTVDAQENPLPTYESNKFYEVVKNVILTNHIICPNMIFINEEVWNAMSDHDKEVVQNAVAKAIAWNDEATQKSEAELVESLKEYEVKFITPDDTIREATIPYIKNLVDDWDLIQSMAE